MTKKCLGLLVLALCLPALAVPDWSKVRLSVIPGSGTQDFQLGEALPREWPESLGAPDSIFSFHGTGEGLNRLAWGNVVKGQLQQGLSVTVIGQGDEITVVRIEIKRIRAGVDKENLFLGLPEANISKRSRSVQKDGKTSYLLPGLAIETEGGKMIGLSVQSPKATRWRFQRWRVRPGLAAGPIKIGEKVDESLFQVIGEPHDKTTEKLVWQAEDSSQSLQVTREKRSGKVTRIRGIGLPWRTPNGATLKDSVSSFKERHPQAKSGLGRGLDETLLKLPGLRATFKNKELISFDIYPIQGK